MIRDIFEVVKALQGDILAVQKFMTKVVEGSTDAIPVCDP